MSFTSALFASLPGSDSFPCRWDCPTKSQDGTSCLRESAVSRFRSFSLPRHQKYSMSTDYRHCWSFLRQMAGNLQAATPDACHVDGQVMKLDTEGFEQLIPPLERGFLEANAASHLKPNWTARRYLPWLMKRRIWTTAYSGRRKRLDLGRTDDVSSLSF
jgi:hypothetical protein